jgi:hypothetical protein
VVLGAVLAVFPAGAGAQELDLCAQPTDADHDGDGWTDAWECAGIPLLPGLSVPGAEQWCLDCVPRCVGNEIPRHLCLDPATPDLFVIVVRATPSGLPPDLLADTNRPRSAGGLGVATHELSVAEPYGGDRRVSGVSSQKAVQLTENLDPDGDYLGIANYGTPNNLDRATIWTARIRRYVEAQCGSGPCQTDQGTPREGIEVVIPILTRWVANHEVGHMFKLTRDFNKRFGGYHLATRNKGDRMVMEQFPVVQTNKKTGGATFFIPHAFADTSRNDMRLSSP